MKQSLVYLHPSKKFSRIAQIEMRIQIDNFWRLGIKPGMVLLITNFNYSYNGFRSITVNDTHFIENKPRSTNTCIVPFIYVNNDEIYWMHDLDAYQQYPIYDEELELDEVDVGFTTYGWSNKWNLGSFFFKRSATDIFASIRSNVISSKEEDENVLVALTKNGIIEPHRYKTLNITYNFGMRKIAENYRQANKPIKVLHFHAREKQKDINVLDVFLRGKNKLKFPLMCDGLLEIFKDHGIQ
jgi:hypothetical protein